MPTRSCHLAAVCCVLTHSFFLGAPVQGQEVHQQPSPPSAAAVLRQVTRGVEVLARGPVHEAFAAPTADPVPTKPIPKAPPKALEEFPPAEKPEGDCMWIHGYWAWDEERNDFLWVSGIWRTPPPGRRWVAGYWRLDGSHWRWVSGFWITGGVQEGLAETLTYLPPPPAPRDNVSPGPLPSRESFYVPGHWVWQEASLRTTGGARLWQGTGFVWRAGYWARMQPGYLWIPDHYRWTPGGCVFIPGYWDLPLADRGVLYAPVVLDRAAFGKTFAFTPPYAVHEALVLDTLFVRPNYGHYYFGDYYGSMYRELGFESVFEYGRHRNDALLDYERYRHRSDPRWEENQFAICQARHAGRAPCPPRTLVQGTHFAESSLPLTQNLKTVHSLSNGNRTPAYPLPFLIPAAELAATQKIRMVSLDSMARTQARQQAQAIQQVGLQRVQLEVKPPVDALIRPRAAMLSLPLLQPLVAQPALAPDVHSTTSTKQGTPSGPLVSAPAVSPTVPALPSQPVPEGKSSFPARAASPPTGIRFQRAPQPSAPSFSREPFQRPLPSQPQQPSSTPEPHKPDSADKPSPAGEPKPF